MYDSPGVIQDLCDLTQDVNCFTTNLSSADYYRIEFDCNSSGICHSGSASSNASNFNSNQSAVIKQGKAVGIAIDKVLNATGKEKVILVGHSMGGLAAREYIQNQIHWQSGNHRVAKLITSGTPHKGSNYTSFGLGSILPNIDERSEAVRDLRTSYFNSNEDGAYLFANNIYETDAWISNSLLWNYRNVDVNCNGQEGDFLTIGLNDRPIPIDLDFACIVGDQDLVVPPSSSNLGDLYNITNLELMNCIGCSHTSISVSTTCLLCVNDYEPIYRTFKALDEPDYLDLAYKVNVGDNYNGYLTFQSPDHPNPNNDDDTYYFYNSSNSNVNIQINNLPDNSVLSAYSSDSPSSLISSQLSSNGNVNLFLSNISPGNYYVKVSGQPYNYPNTGVATPWDNPYSLSISSDNSANINSLNSTKSKILIGKFNILSQKIHSENNQLIFRKYSDGSVERKFTIK